MASYVIERAGGTVDLTGQEWLGANVALVDQFPWFTSGVKEKTQARALYDDQALYLQFHCSDSHISAEARALNGPVCRDSCVEFFASPHPDLREHYFNFEANCCGALHLGFAANRLNRQLVDAAAAKAIRVVSSIDAPTKDEQADDKSWWLAARIPFAVVAEMAQMPIAPRKGDRWRGNMYRCGGVTNPQYACWNWIDLPKPDFHTPKFFGEMIFG